MMIINDCYKCGKMIVGDECLPCGERRLARELRSSIPERLPLNAADVMIGIAAAAITALLMTLPFLLSDSDLKWIQDHERTTSIIRPN